MPPRVALRFVAYHGDPAHLPFVVAQMSDAQTARYAGWVWQTITGVDLQTAGMALAESELLDSAPIVTHARLDADVGMALPNAQAISRYAITALGNGKRYLLGQQLTLAHMLNVLEVAPQALRSIAAMHLHLNHPEANIALRSPAQIQMHALSAMRAMA
jgi:hypothetical protein